jgi:hypothetical protein
MQYYVAWCSGDLLIIGWCGSWQLVNNMNILHIKKITLKLTCSGSSLYKYRGCEIFL